MAEPANDGLRDLAEQVVLAAVGAVSLTAERVDGLADDLAERGGLRREEARALARDLASRWRGDSIRVSERAGSTVQGALKQLGLALREEVEDLELRVAQLEHRLRLLEEPSATPRRR